MITDCPLTTAHQELSIRVAFQSIDYGLRHHRPIWLSAVDFPEVLREVRPVFVTLRIQHDLRGCIGTLEYTQPLILNVAQYAYASAFSDPRFPPLEWNEFEQINLSISVLSPLEELNFDSECSFVAQVRPGIDGLLLEEGCHRATLLPSVWEAIPDKEEFLRRLKIKAGLSANYWSSTVRVKRYTAYSIQSQRQ
jgi:hypothetical protein